jgi:Arc/MetJ family transcription regulator
MIVDCRAPGAVTIFTQVMKTSSQDIFYSLNVPFCGSPLTQQQRFVICNHCDATCRAVYNTLLLYTSASTMRTNIVIDDALMKNALKATGLKTKKEAVELGLQTLVQLNRQADIRKLRGKLKWEGDLRESRSMER